MSIGDKLKTFVSKRLLSLFLTGVAAPFLISHGVPETTVNWLIMAVLTYVGGQSVVEAVSAKAAATKAPSAGQVP